MAPLPRSRQDIALFQEEVKTFPVGAKVLAHTNLHTNLARSAAGRKRDPDMMGTVIGHNQQRLRIRVRWDHPDYADKPGHPDCEEDLAGRYLQLVEEHVGN